MTVKNHFFVYTILLFCYNSAVAQTTTPNWFTIKGFLPAWNGATVELSMNDRLIKRDTIQNDIYTFTGTTSEIKEAQLKITKNKKSFFLPLFIEPGTIKIRDEKQHLVAYGTNTNDAYSQLIDE